MRFAKLILERYGRFEGCELDFRRRGPDLHVIYGPNEAGKSTSLSAVSDLLFGFPTRSPYNFLFDYSLLRVGAVVEEDGRTLTCRRRKSGGSTLVDADERPILDADLLAMLKGQTRDTFRLSFSLDQKALREGGQAIVKAKDDVGQALFAAGSGLTTISEHVKRIEEETDAIWGRRAKGTRTYTRAERELETSVRAVRDASLKPKSWTDARDAKDGAKQRLEAIEEERKALLVENQQLQRLRRVAGNVRLRQDVLEQIAAAAPTAELTEAAETAAVADMAGAEAATRAKAVAERLLEELDERAGQQSPDPEVLGEAAAIEALILEFGGATKAAKDLIRLEGQRAAAADEVARFRGRAGAVEGGALAADVVAQLRELAREHGTDLAALEEIQASRDELEDRRKRLKAALEAGGQEEVGRALVDAVDAARRLGSDADDRCVAAFRLADDAAVDLEQALARLRPWTGGADELASLPTLGDAELDRTKDAWAGQRDALYKEDATAQRLETEVERVRLQIELAGTGAAISRQEVADSREARDGRWMPLRAHLLGDSTLQNPSEDAAAFEQAVAATDGIADRRFAFAEESARLAGLEATRAERDLEAEQARRRAEIAKERLESLAIEWRQRQLSLGLPELEPDQLASWFGERAAALQAQADRVRLKADADRLEERRTTAVTALRAALNEHTSDDVPELAAILGRAERKRGEIEAETERLNRGRDSLDQLEVDLAGLERRQTATSERAEPRRLAWERLLSGARIALDIATADARLAAIDELRQAEEAIAALDRRIEGIRRDAADFRSQLTAVAGRLGMAAADDDEHVVRELRTRLDKARSAKLVLDEIEKDRVKRRSEIDRAAAELAVAMGAIAPLLEQTAAADPAALSDAIDRSRALRGKREALAAAEAAIIRDGDGVPLDDLVAMVLARDPDELATRSESIERELQEVNVRASEAATAHGEASRAFGELERETGTA
ncbi:MAG: AAA family ATPase, partial [Sphingomicrobium sp.]